MKQLDWIGAVTLIVATLGLAGCGGIDGVEFNAFGVSSGNSGPRDEPTVAQRSSLVVPPTNDLPAPGSGRVAQADASWPVDAEDRKASQEAEMAALIKKYCQDAKWMKLTKLDEYNKVTQNGQLCRSAIADYISGAAKKAPVQIQ